jgi:hypothetical protein
LTIGKRKDLKIEGYDEGELNLTKSFLFDTNYQQCPLNIPGA